MDFFDLDIEGNLIGWNVFLDNRDSFLVFLSSLIFWVLIGIGINCISSEYFRAISYQEFVWKSSFDFLID
jgi:hypothetical protein